MLCPYLFDFCVTLETTLTEILSARMTKDKKISHHEDQHPHHSLDDSLYNCLRCAMETIQINTDVSTPSTARDERFDYDYSSYSLENTIMLKSTCHFPKCKYINSDNMHF